MGGDHKCPLCSATFTRPQHVGRHLRAHTGDRPYECKECPLRFARSDLLSRHVNKAHPKPNGVHDSHKNEKKGRSKSLNTATGMAPPRPPPNVANVGPRVSLHPEPTAYQAQRMYPNHPLLQQSHNAGGAGGSGAWGTTGGLDLSGTGVANFSMGLGGQPVPQMGPDVIGSVGNATAAGMNFLQRFGNPPFTYAPSDASHLTPYDLAINNANIGTIAGHPPVATFGYELNTKKRACDQCNHSKVRCDFADPCARCSYRHVQCTYTKPQRTARARNATYPMLSMPAANVTTSPHRTQSLTQPGTTLFSSPVRVQGDNDAAAAMARNDSAQSSTSSDMVNADGQRIRPPIPESQWDKVTYTHPRSHSVSTVSSIGTGSIVSQSPSSGLGLSLTPSLTNETSPSVGSDGPDRRGSQTNSTLNNGTWVLPPSLMNHDSAVKFVNNFVAQQNADGDTSNTVRGNPQLLWPNHPGGIDTSMLPTDAISVTEDDAGDTPPEFNSGTRTRRRSSQGVWANALKDMHIADDQTLLDPALAEIDFSVPQSVRVSDDGSQTPFDRNWSGSDVNLWKLFLDPCVLATPLTFNSDTPRLSKSNSAPDLTTPAVGNDVSNPWENMGQKNEATDMDDEGTAKPKNAKSASDDSEVRDKWKNHISQRHASFSMNLDPAAAVRTRALTNATFASSTSPTRQIRPSLHPLMNTSGGDETLAPARLPSFGPAAFDMNGVLLPPNCRGPPTPARQAGMPEARPTNKRQASQTLVGDLQKRSTFSLFTEEDGDASSDPSRPGPGSSAANMALRNAKLAANVPQNIPTWQAADASRAC